MTTPDGVSRCRLAPMCDLVFTTPTGKEPPARRLFVWVNKPWSERFTCAALAISGAVLTQSPVASKSRHTFGSWKTSSRASP
eukprot:scaffold25552_cov34-Phaeocystis_antarctica.AAC.2